MKRIIYLLLAFLYTINSVLAYSPSCSTVGSLPYGSSWTSPNKVVGTQVLGNDNTLLTPIDTICGTDLPALPGKASTETITGTWTFNTAPAFSSGGPPTSSNECDASGELCPYESVVRDTGDQTITGVKTFTTSPVLSEECNATGDACAYESVVRDTGDQTVAGVKTFSSAPISSVAASGATELTRLGEVNTLISAVTAGGCSYSTSAPVGACTQGACHNRFTSSGIVAYVCTSGGGWVQSNADAVSKAVGYTGAITISSSGNLTVTGANSFTGTHTVTGTSTFSSSGVYVPTPTESTQAATKGYADNLSPRKFAQTTAVTVNNTTPASIIGAGSGSYSQSSGSITIPANTFTPGKTLKITASGVYTRGTGTLNLTLTLGGQQIGVFSIGDPGTATSNSTWRIESIVTCVTTGSPGTFYGQGLFWRGSTGAGTNWNVSGTGSSSTFNLTTSSTQDISSTATWSATAGSITCTNFVVEVI